MSIVPGRDVPEVPQEWVDAVNKAINDANHEDLCSSLHTLAECGTYQPGQWDIGVDLDIAVGALEPLIRERDCQRGDHWKRVAVEIEQDRDRLLALLDQARTLRITPRSLEALIAAEVHSPARVRAFLAANGWTLADQREKASKWVNATVTRPGWAEPGSAVTVLDWTGFSDYAHHLALTVADLATLHGMGELQVLHGVEEAGDA